jgi:hypothetical protein
MKKPLPVEPVLIEHLDRYNRELKKFLSLGFTDTDSVNGRLRTRELTYQERIDILGEIVRIEQEIRVLSYYADTVNRFHERLMNDAEESGKRIEIVRNWRENKS